MSIVYVQDRNGNPLMPTARCGKVKHLLREGRARVVSRCPFTVRLTYDSKTYTQPLTLGLKTGTKEFGVAVAKEDGTIVYQSETQQRTDIRLKLEQRRDYRRSRRSRKTRRRKCRGHRGNSLKKGRTSPTVRSKTDAQLREITCVKRILPVTKTLMETARYDTALLANPEIASDPARGYRQGPQYGFENLKAAVLDRDGHTCQNPGCNHKSPFLEVHHIVFRSEGGPDRLTNLVTLCRTCHGKLHRGKLDTSFLKDNPPTDRLDAESQANHVCAILKKKLPDAETVFGYLTKLHCQNLGLKRSKMTDAAVIATGGRMPVFPDTAYRKVKIPRGSYKRTRGKHSEERLPHGRTHGFRRYDKVEYLSGTYFIQGTMSSGYCFLMDIDRKRVNFPNAPKGMKTPKLANCKRLSARKSCMVMAIHPIV